MNELALFAGNGGGLLGTRLLGWRPICAVEINPFCRDRLIQRQEDRLLDFFPIWDDIKTFDGRPWNRYVDIITGGFPCQPYSRAGSRLGNQDSRNLWPDTARVIREVKPRYLLLENVDELLTYEYFGTILKDLAESGYSVRYRIISAADVGAPHLRKRLWIMGDSEFKGLEGSLQSVLSEERRNSETRSIKSTSLFGRGWWATEPTMGRVADGMADWVDRIKAIGNGQVPGVVRAAWHLLNGDN